MIELSFKNKLKEFNTALHKQIRSEFNNYYQSAHWNNGREHGDDTNETIPFWIKIPIIISSNFPKRELKYLEDFLWAQMCAYLHVRIIDDLIDLETKDNNLTLIATMFLLESEKALQKHFWGDEKFWKLYYSLWSETLTGMQNKQVIEKSMSPSPQKIIKYHGYESSILNIGTAAVCRNLHLGELFGILKDLTYNLVIAAQIIDDLTDIENDLNHGLRNYAVAEILKKNNWRGVTNNQLIEKFVRSKIKSDDLKPIFRDANKFIKRAKQQIEQIRSLRILSNVEELNDEIKLIEKSIIKEKMSPSLWSIYN